MKIYEILIKEIFNKNKFYPFMGHGLKALELNFAYDNLVVDKSYNILGLFNSPLEWINGYIWGAKYSELKTLKETDYYRFFFFNGKEIGKEYNWIDVYSEKVNQDYYKEYGKEVIICKNKDDNIYYAILFNGKIVEADPLFEKGIL